MATQTRSSFEPASASSAAAVRRTPNRAAVAPAGGAAWLQLAGLLVTAGCLAAAVAGVAGHHEWQLPMAGTGAGLAAIASVAAVRSRTRSRRVARTAERVAPLIGFTEATPYQLAQLLHVRWPLGAQRNDPPTRITVRPPASYPLTDTTRLERIADVTGRALRVQLRVAAVHQRRHELVLLPNRLGDDPIAEPAPPELRCAEVVVEQRLGIDAAIVATTYHTDDAGARHLDTLDVQFIVTDDNAGPKFWTDFETAVNRQVPGRWRVVPDLVADPVTRQARCRIERKPALRTRIPYDLELLDEVGEHQIPYAVDESGRLVTWSLDISPHMLVSGATRSGKSSTLRNVVRGFIARGWPALVCDPRRAGLLGMRGWPGVQALATPTDTRQMIAIVEHVHAEMDRRFATIEAGVIRKSDLEPLLLVLDEYGELREEMTLWWAREGAPTAGRRRTSAPPVFDRIDAIARLGGEAGVHLLIGIKRPDVDAKVLPAELRNNCRCRCSHGALTRDEADAMWGNGTTGRSVPPMVQGRGTGVQSDGTPGEIQSLWLPDPLELSDDDTELYRRIEPTESPHPWLSLVGDGFISTTTPPSTPWTERGSASEVGLDERELGYDGAELVAAGTVGEADLIEMDAGADVWLVVDHVAADPDEPDLLYIDGRVVDSGQPRTIVAAEDAMIPRRRQR